MKARVVLQGTFHAAGLLLAVGYAVLPLPVLIFAAAAYSDYQDRGCPEAWQCSDASAVMNIAIFYVLAASVIWLLFKGLRKAANSLGGEADA